MLPRCNVVVPFAEQIAELYPTDRIEARRSFPHLLAVVRASALLHYRQREQDSSGEILATIEDYQVAESLTCAPLSAATGGLSDAARNYMDALKNKFAENEFKTTDAQLVGTGSRSTKYSRLTALVAVGCVEQTEAAKGRVPAKWRLTDVSSEVPSILPTAAKVGELFGRTR